MKSLSLALAIVAAAVAAPASSQNNAQGKSDWDKIVLEDKAGNVMTSVGGDYVTAFVGKELVVGEHMMLSGDKTKAKVVYYELDDDGDVVRKCVKDYVDPDTYIIDATCVPAAVWAHTGAASGVNAGIITGTAVIGGVILHTRDSTPPGPLSTGVRHF